MKLRRYFRSMTLAAFAMAGLCSAISTAQASSVAGIGVDFIGDTGSGLSSSASPGVVLGTNYNNLNDTGSSNLNYFNGTASGATLSFSGSFNNGHNPATNTPNSATNTMYSEDVYGTTSATFSLTVSNVPFPDYNVYVYSMVNNQGFQVSDTLGSTTYYYEGNAAASTATSLLQTTSTTSGSPTLGAAEYQEFPFVTSSSFTVTFGGNQQNVDSNQVFGLEIVDTPEPGSVGLALLGGAALLARRRRVGVAV